MYLKFLLTIFIISFLIGFGASLISKQITEKPQTLMVQMHVYCEKTPKDCIKIEDIWYIETISQDNFNEILKAANYD